MPRTYRVGEWLVQPELNRLTSGDSVVRLEPKVMEVLDVLVERAGDVVPRADLMSRVWPDVFVSDDVLHRAVRELRRVFGDAAADPSYVETIRKRGYRLIAPVEPVAAPERAAAPRGAAEPRTAAPVAVALPPRDRIRTAAFAAVAAVLLVLVCAGVIALAMRFGPPASPNGVRFHSLVSGPLNERDPALGPDGRLAFAAYEATDGQADLFLLETPGEPPRRLTSDPADDRLPVWSPDGAMLAFARLTAASCDILTLSLASGVETRVAPCGNRHEPRVAWSADGRWLVHSLAPDPQLARGWQIARTSVESGAREPLTLPPPGAVGDHSPVVSSSGAVAFIRTVGGGVSDVHAVPIGGGAVRRVTHDDGDVAGVAWTDEGRALIYASDRAGGYSLWRVPAEGGAPRLVAGGAAKLKHPHALGGLVAYEAWAYEINVWRADLTGGAARALIRTSDLWNYHPQPSPDGTRLAFVSTRSGATEIWVAGADGAAPRQLTAFGRASLRAPRWSPDGTRLVVSALVGGHADLYLVDAASGRTRRLISDPGDDVAPAWSGDGEHIYYGARRDGVWRVLALSLDCALAASGDDDDAADAAAPVAPADPRAGCGEVVIDHGYAAQEAPGGGALYFTRADRAGLWRQPLPGGEPELVLASRPAGDWANWQVTPAGIYFYATTPRGTTAVYRASLDGRGVEEVAGVSELAWSGLAVTADGSGVLFARADRRESNIAAVETVEPVQTVGAVR